MIALPDEIARRLNECAALPAPPPVASRVIELSHDPSTTLGTLAEVIGGDAALAAKVMRIANSALYARRRKSTNIRQALIVLGLNTTLTLTLGCTLAASLRRTPTQGIGFDSYWRRAILAGIWGKLLASEFGRSDIEEVSLAALLQDVGMLAIDRVEPELYRNRDPLDIDHMQLARDEASALNCDHRAIGAWLLDAWKLPGHLATAVRHSHDITAAGVAADLRSFVRAVAMSGELAELLSGDRNEAAVRRAGLEAHRTLGILPNRLAEMFDAISEHLAIAEDIFDVELLDRSQLREATATAREILMTREVHTMTENCPPEPMQRPRKYLTVQKRGPESLADIPGRRELEAAIASELETAKQLRWPVSVVLVELDSVQQINASRGYQCGDQMLTAVAQLLRRNLRDVDVLARYDGGRFVLVLPGLDTDSTSKVAHRLLQSAKDLAIPTGDGEPLMVSLSLGTATQSPDGNLANPAELLAAADQALYHSKRSGRDRHSRYDAIEVA
jgi:diguanylate cyclase (GGDEF)-like protein